MPDADFERFRLRTARRYAWLDAALLQRYARAYGTRIERLLDGCTVAWPTSARPCCRDCTRARSNTCGARNSRVTAEDILFRRSKLGVHLPAGSAARLDAWLAASP